MPLLVLEFVGGAFFVCDNNNNNNYKHALCSYRPFPPSLPFSPLACLLA